MTIEQDKLADEKLYSTHVFLFPFEWKYQKKQNKDFEQQTSLVELEDLIKQHDWELKQFQLERLVDYNEYNYFYNFVREILYDTGDILPPLKNSSNLVLRHFEYKLNTNVTNTYQIEIEYKDDNKYKEKKYSLEIDSILLHLYNTGVGILSFHLNNRKQEQSAPKDILNINQYGRRIYPPFFDLDQNSIGSNKVDEDKEFTQGLLSDTDAKRGVVRKELAKKIWLQLGDKAIGNTSFIDRYKQPDFFKKGSFVLPAFIEELFPDVFTTFETAEDKPVFLSPSLDDRMFVISWYGHNALTRFVNQKRANNYAYSESDWWYKYTFVDGGMKTCQNDFLAVQHIQQATNDRWVNFGTLYGITRYSFVCLTGQLSHLQKDYINAAFLVNHVQTIYYKLVELVLLQRACVLRFSDEVVAVANMENKEQVHQRIESLYKLYIQFINKIYFREITAQEQGIELYDLLQEKMRVERDVKNLESEIRDLHQYALLLQDEKQSKREERFNKNIALISALFLVPGFITGFYGMNLFNDELQTYDYFELGLVIVFVGMTAVLTFYYFLAQPPRKRRLGIALFTLLGLTMLFPYWRGERVTEKETGSTVTFPDSLEIQLDTATQRLIIPLKDFKLQQQNIYESN